MSRYYRAHISRIVRVFQRAAIFAMLWYVLNGDERASWIAGVPAIASATAASMLLQSSGRFRLKWRELMSFAPFFVWKSLAGSLDVSRRALRPGLPLRPMLVHHTFRYPAGAWRVFMANALTLMPGTLNAELQDDRMTVHVLDGSEELVTRNLRDLEDRVVRIFGAPERNV